MHINKFGVSYNSVLSTCLYASFIGQRVQLAARGSYSDRDNF
jgi:hypothetical protein